MSVFTEILSRNQRELWRTSEEISNSITFINPPSPTQQVLFTTDWLARGLRNQVL